MGLTLCDITAESTRLAARKQRWNGQDLRDPTAQANNRDMETGIAQSAIDHFWLGARFDLFFLC